MSAEKHEDKPSKKKFVPVDVDDAKKLQDARGDMTPAFVHWLNDNAHSHEISTQYAGREVEYAEALKSKK